MPVTLKTTLANISEVPNEVNVSLIQEYYQYLKSNGTGETHQINSIKDVTNFAKTLKPEMSFYDIKGKEGRAIILKYLDSKLKSSEDDPEVFSAMQCVRTAYINSRVAKISMQSAYVLINCELGAEKGVVDALRNISGVAEVHSVYGIYDIVVKVASDTTEGLNKIITWQIRRIPKVRSTVTMIVIESHAKTT
jgi:hypothetical protein